MERLFSCGFAEKVPEIESANKKWYVSHFGIVISIFDPLGCLALLTLQSRLIFQEICEDSVGWDESVRSEQLFVWRKWLECVRKISTVEIERCYQLCGQEMVNEAELHIFSDASVKAYAVVGYWVFRVRNSPTRVAFIMSKARVVPKKDSHTIPRL
ncbi:hypothetical protein TKK_0001655 [Trichogramma kaykai]